MSLAVRRRAHRGALVAGLVGIGAVTVVVAPGWSGAADAPPPELTPIVLDGTTETVAAISDDGTVVLMERSPSESAGEAESARGSLVVHDLATGSTTSVADLTPSFAALSGDGCTIAGTRPAVDVDRYEVVVVDRCPEPPAPPIVGPAVVDAETPADESPAEAPDLTEVVPVVVGEFAVTAPLALDAAGSTLVIGAGAEVIRLGRDDTGSFVEVDRASPEPPADGAAVGVIGRIDVTDDGSVVVFDTRLDPEVDVPSTPSASTVHVWEGDQVAVLLTAASDPSMSGDGRLVAVDHDTAEPATSGIHVVDRVPLGGEVQVRPIGPGHRPSMSADGVHVVLIADDAGVQRATWIGAGDSGSAADQPFAAVEVTDLSFDVTTTDPDTESDADAETASTDVEPAVADVEDQRATSLSVSRYGEVIVADDPLSGDVIALAEPVAASFDAERYDLRAGVAGVPLTATVVLANDGRRTIDLDAAALSVGEPFRLASTDPGDAVCAGLLRPGASCVVEVVLDLVPATSVAARLLLVLDGDTAAVAVVAANPSSAPSPSPGTTPNTVPNTTPPRPPSTSPRPTTPPTTRPTTTTTVPAAPTVTPSSFEFAPTIVDAGRRVAAFGLTNASVTPAVVTDLRLAPADGPFEIVAGAGLECIGASLAAGASCAVEVAFAPTAPDVATASLVAAFSDGTEVSVAIVGTGAPTPRLTVIPAVAAAGQVVTIQGGGYPTGAIVEVTVGDERAPRSAVVDDVGTFVLPVVVLPNTQPGPVNVSAAGQVDLYPDSSTSLLVAGSGDRTSPGVLRGVGPNIGR